MRQYIQAIFLAIAAAIPAFAADTLTENPGVTALRSYGSSVGLITDELMVVPT